MAFSNNVYDLCMPSTRFVYDFIVIIREVCFIFVSMLGGTRQITLPLFCRYFLNVISYCQKEQVQDMSLLPNLVFGID